MLTKTPHFVFSTDSTASSFFIFLSSLIYTLLRVFGHHTTRAGHTAPSEREGSSVFSSAKGYGFAILFFLIMTHGKGNGFV